MSQLDDRIAQLQTDVANETTVTQSAVTLLTSIPQLIEDAVAKAVAQGATPAQLQALTDLQSGLEKNATDLAAAVTAGTTSSAPAPTSAPTPPTA